jgi:hypothetical protein
MVVDAESTPTLGPHEMLALSAPLAIGIDRRTAGRPLGPAGGGAQTCRSVRANLIRAIGRAREWQQKVCGELAGASQARRQVTRRGSDVPLTE